MLFFGKLGYRVIAHDRRGHGRSDQTWHDNGMNTHAEDLATLLDTRDIKNAMMIDHSTIRPFDRRSRPLYRPDTAYRACRTSLVEIEGGSHAMCITHADRINADLLKFLTT